MIKLTPEKPPYYEQGVSVKTYKAILNQTGTANPIATILGPNTIGNILWTRNNVGTYAGTLIGAFPETKTYVQLTQNGTNASKIINGGRNIGFDDEIYIETKNAGGPPTQIDMEGQAYITITIYT